ncbi:hypothetical protein MKL09_08815 [Methylobacterium sp. J-048]|uniref:hypothetical protein n=1 Tax=Methylobacterium sp. J-048 TaxID=2836635 RepID=UPI001FB93B4A|nr:hypothetical protein [Methylobacterium sp. J-048]MCJ2056655.1 hypothetical protein [Methylobacterium sp. J-048]
MSEPVSVSVIAAAFDLSERRIGQLADKGIVIRVGRGKFDLLVSTANYCRHLREVASGRGEDSPDLTAERTRLAKEQADRIAIENERTRGTILLADEALHRWSAEMVKLRAQLLAVSGKVAMALPQLTPHEVREIDRVVRNAMTAIAGGEA